MWRSESNPDAGKNAPNALPILRGREASARLWMNVRIRPLQTAVNHMPSKNVVQSAAFMTDCR